VECAHFTSLRIPRSYDYHLPTLPLFLLWLDALTSPYYGRQSQNEPKAQSSKWELRLVPFLVSLSSHTLREQTLAWIRHGILSPFSTFSFVTQPSPPNQCRYTSPFANHCRFNLSRSVIFVRSIVSSLMRSQGTFVTCLDV
jgi:hypothetical protein